MKHENLILAIDAGNTSIKIGVFKNNDLEKVVRYKSGQLNDILQFVNLMNPKSVAVSSVISDDFVQFLKKNNISPFIVSQNVRLAIDLDYKTPSTLGIDRICNAVAISNANRNKNSVSIDIGTCVKFDFVDSTNIYLGGSISPGINLRYKSLNDYTANLPLLNNKGSAELIGKSTSESIHSGVINGVKAEIDSLIQYYQNEFGVLTFFVTGGDAKYFDFEGKNNIFVDENLTLKGLFQIYLLNAE